MAEKPELPQPWYFYNLKQSIDEPHKSFSEAALDSISGKFGQSPTSKEQPSQEELTKLEREEAEKSSDVPLYSQATLRRTISPVTQWIPFNPGDAKRILEEAQKDPTKPVAVGHQRMMFEVVEEKVLKPIYWPISYTTKVAKCHWVFSYTLTPINPAWDSSIVPLFQNFLENIETYNDVLASAKKDANHMKAIVQRLNLMQTGKELKVDVLFSPRNSNVYLFKADSSYVCSKSTADALLNGTMPRGILAVLEPFKFAEYKRLYSLPDRPSDDPNYIPLPINNLIMVFHGVGQKLSDQYSRINFVYAIDKLRVEVEEANEAPDVNKHFPGGNGDSVRTLVLPVNWRSAFNNKSKVDVSSIIVPNLGPLRQSFSDAMLDIPLYMSENRRPDMLAAAASEANRLYSLVLAHHPTFAENGRTHLIGHSLGSLITADLLTHQPSYLDHESIKDAPFKFQTTNYFTTGSMLGVFMMLKGEHLRSHQAFDAEFGGAGTSGKEVNRPFGCFAVDNLYNIINQNDLLSFLVNGTVIGAKSENAQKLVGKDGRPLEADELPSVPIAPSSSLFSSATAVVSKNTSSSNEKSPSPKPKDNSDAMDSEPVEISVRPVRANTAPSSSSAPGEQNSSSADDADNDADKTDSENPSTRLIKNTSGDTNGHSRSSSLGRFWTYSFFNYQKGDQEKEESDQVEREPTPPPEIPQDVKDFQHELGLINENGQIDWLIPQVLGYIPSQYLKMFTAHFDYWSNKELARFLAIECGRKLGAENTLSEHRAKWSYKP